ncbi:hypothetical protein HMPREF9551_00850, partial [Escherichia coli MS 196-1]
RADSPFSKTLTLLSTEPGDKPGKNMCAKNETPGKAAPEALFP